jgi:hypothetical protein
MHVVPGTKAQTSNVSLILHPGAGCHLPRSTLTMGTPLRPRRRPKAAPLADFDPWLVMTVAAWRKAATVVSRLNKLEKMNMGRGILLWLLGVPIPIIILLALIWH